MRLVARGDTEARGYADPRIKYVGSIDAAEVALLVRNYGIVVIPQCSSDFEFDKLLSALGGRVVTHPFLPESDGRVYSILEREADKPGAFIYGGAWHQNLMFMQEPPDITILYADSVPDSGNYTAFVDLSQVDSWLTDGVKSVLSTLHAVHSTTAPLSPQNALPDVKAERSRMEATHPCYLADQTTGRSWPFVMSNYITRFDGWHPRESTPLISALYAFAQSDEFVIRAYWRPGDLLVWDNTRYMHRATVTHHLGPRRFLRGDIALGWLQERC